MYRWARTNGFKFNRIHIVLIVLAFLFILEIITFLATVDNYGSYSFVKADKYVTFEMPESDTLTEEQWNNLISNAEMDSYPVAQLYTEKKHIRSQYLKRIEEYDITLEEYLEESNLNEDEFEEMIENLAKQNVKEKLILTAICREKGITVTKEEIKTAKQQIISDRGARDAKDFERLTGETIDKHCKDIDLKSQLLYSKLVVFV